MKQIAEAGTVLVQAVRQAQKGKGQENVAPTEKRRDALRWGSKLAAHWLSTHLHLSSQ